MREQSPQERIKNFQEVPYGYNEDEALKEAARCLQCKNSPCVAACPAEVNIPAFILAIKEKRFLDADRIVKSTNNLPAVCGRVCPQEDQCEKLCVLNKMGKPVKIGNLERFIADWSRNNGSLDVEQNLTVSKKKKKVAVIGAGPAGLTCAADLAKLGYPVTVFEALHKPGGVLTYGIPEFRLPKDIVIQEVRAIEKIGVELKLNYIIGKIKTIDVLRKEGFSAFFIACGAGLPYFLGIPGENLSGVYSANEFLTRVNLMKAYKFPEYDTPINVGKNVGVVGGGNVAMDSARCALRLGAEKVFIIYRRTEDEMPARIDEVHHAKQEGIHFNLLTSPVEIKANNQAQVTKMLCLKNKLGQPDASGRRRPVAISGSEFEIELDTVVIAIGNGPNPILLDTIKNLQLSRKGNVQADEKTGKTNIRDVFAGGDIVTGSATVIAAMGAGKQAAKSIDKFLRNNKVS